MAAEDGQQGPSRDPLPAPSPPIALLAWGLALPTLTPTSPSPSSPQGWRAGHWGHFQG